MAMAQRCREDEHHGMLNEGSAKNKLHARVTRRNQWCRRPASDTSNPARHVQRREENEMGEIISCGTGDAPLHQTEKVVRRMLGEKTS
jgi:hypothetical protein